MIQRTRTSPLIIGVIAEPLRGSATTAGVEPCSTDMPPAAPSGLRITVRFPSGATRRPSSECNGRLATRASSLAARR